MRIAATADTHLGYRAYPTVRLGRNAREQDVESAWDQMIDAMVLAAPDLVVISGDVFHRARVSNFALSAYLCGLRVLIESTQANIVVLTGNHEAARTAETLSPNELTEVFGHPRLHAIKSHTWWSEDDYQIMAIPFETGGGEAVSPPPRVPGKVNILAIHGAIQAPGIPKFYADEKCISIDYLAEHFDVVCAGDMHDHTMLENDGGCIAFYPGSTEYTSNNIWAEDPKGWVLVDTEAGTAEFQRIETRRVVDLVGTEGCRSAEGLNASLAEILEQPQMFDGEPIMRLVVKDFDRADRPNIDHKLVKQIKSMCLHFRLDVQCATATNGAGEVSTYRARSLQDMATEFFAGDPSSVRDRALSLIDERWIG